MRKRTIPTFAICIGFVAAACGGSSSDDGGGGSNVGIDDVPALYAASACKAFSTCFGPVFDIFLAGEDCEANYETAIADELPRIKQAIDGGTVVYDGTKFDACAKAIVASGCALAGEPPECTAALDGTVEIGGDCQMDVECKGGDTYCKTGAACPGSCQKKELAGGMCGRDGDCAAGLVCSKDTQKCIVPAALGADCEGGSSPPCAPGTFCIGSEDNPPKPGKCMSNTEAFSGKQGESCYFGGAPACSPELRCIVTGIGTGGIETACQEPYASGVACKPGIPDPCPVDEYCNVPQNSLDGTCTPRPKAGEPCAKLFNDDVCAPNTRCDGGTCRPRQKLGGTCQSDAVCYSENCVNGGCAPEGGCS